MSKKHDKDFLMSRKYATFVANEYDKRIEKAIDYINKHTNNEVEYLDIIEVKELKNILAGEDKDE